MGFGSLKNVKAWFAFALMFAAISFGLRKASENNVPIVGDLADEIR